jgi:putrescine:ornithine antiporter
MMKAAGVPGAKYRLNAVVTVAAMLYSVYALYASGKDAVLGGMLVTALVFVIWGFIAPRFSNARNLAAPSPTGVRAVAA